MATDAIPSPSGRMASDTEQRSPGKEDWSKRLLSLSNKNKIKQEHDVFVPKRSMENLDEGEEEDTHDVKRLPAEMRLVTQQLQHAACTPSWTHGLFRVKVSCARVSQVL